MFPGPVRCTRVSIVPPSIFRKRASSRISRFFALNAIGDLAPTAGTLPEREKQRAPRNRATKFFVTHVHARSLRVKHTTCYELSLPITRRSVVGVSGNCKCEQRAVSQAFTK